MKKYLFGLGAMLVGAGLMFVLMHGEVSAEGESDRCDLIEISTFGRGGIKFKTYNENLTYCKIRDLTCVIGSGKGISCVKTKGGIFK